MSNDDFEINGTTLAKYRGNDDDVIIPDCIKFIGNFSFQGKSVKSVLIPDTVGAIGINAFHGSSLKNIVIPDSVCWLENYVFSGCKELESVVLPNNIDIINQGLFENCTKI